MGICVCLMWDVHEIRQASEQEESPELYLDGVNLHAHSGEGHVGAAQDLSFRAFLSGPCGGYTPGLKEALL